MKILLLIKIKNFINDSFFYNRILIKIKKEIFLKKNLAVLIYSLSGGGAERVVSILLKELKDYYNITLFLMNDKIVYKIPDDIKIIYLEKSNNEENSFFKIFKIPFLAFKYKELCNQNHIDISLSFMYRPNFINVFSKCLGNKAKTLISERNTASMTYSGNNLGSFIGRFLVKRLYSKADLIIPNSIGNAEDLINNFNIDQKRIKIINNPVNIELINSLIKEEVADVDFDKFTFISVARLEKHKNHDITIKAYSKLASSNNQLLILGVGNQHDYLQELIDILDLNSQVKLLGFRKNPYKYISLSDCFVLSSSREGFPNALVEALACGITAISSNCKSGPNEILKNSKYSFLYNVEDINDLTEKMEKQLLSSYSKKDILFENEELINEFKQTKIVNKFIEVL